MDVSLVFDMPLASHVALQFSGNRFFVNAIGLLELKLVEHTFQREIMAKAVIAKIKGCRYDSFVDVSVDEFRTFASLLNIMLFIVISKAMQRLDFSNMSTETDF
jgi:hypothetical protein